MSSMMSWGWWPSTLQPTDWVAPRISLMGPESSLAKDRFRICQAMLTVSSKVMFPLCLMFFCFLLSLGGSLGPWWSVLNLGLSVLNGQFHSNPQTLPITSCLGDVITNLFWRQTQGANLGGQGRRGTNFPTGAPQVHDFDLVGVELRQHGGGGWCRMNPDLGRLKKVAPWPPLSQKLEVFFFFFKFFLEYSWFTMLC